MNVTFNKIVFAITLYIKIRQDSGIVQANIWLPERYPITEGLYTFELGRIPAQSLVCPRLHQHIAQRCTIKM